MTEDEIKQLLALTKPIQGSSQKAVAKKGWSTAYKKRFGSYISLLLLSTFFSFIPILMQLGKDVFGSFLLLFGHKDVVYVCVMLVLLTITDFLGELRQRPYFQHIILWQVGVLVLDIVIYGIVLTMDDMAQAKLINIAFLCSTLVLCVINYSILSANGREAKE
ncbi:MAG: hypothetical protein LBS96_02280 [Oscillospiraceae bacterium]|nr:hypothetical protein [Oscillospiraceae bacterium]